MNSASTFVLILVLAATAAGADSGVAIPAWVVPYKGAAAEVRMDKPALVDTVYTTPAKPDEVLRHYEKLFETAGEVFRPNFDGLGTTLRAAPAGCDLMIRVKPVDEGSEVRTSCAAKTGNSPYGAMITGPVTPPKPAEPPSKAEDGKDARVAKAVAEEPPRKKVELGPDGQPKGRRAPPPGW